MVGGASVAGFFSSCFQRLVGFIWRNLCRKPGALLLGLYLFLPALDSRIPFERRLRSVVPAIFLEQGIYFRAAAVPDKAGTSNLTHGGDDRFRPLE